MKRFQDGIVVVELREGSVQLGQEEVVHTGMAHIVANRRYQQGKGIKGREQRGNWGRRNRGRGDASIWRESADMEKHAEHGL